MSDIQINVPVGFFVFNRLDTTVEVFNTIRAAKPTKLYIISDGAREEKPDEKEKVEEVRKYIEGHIDWNCEVKKNYAEKNMGCKLRISSGISWVLDNEEMAIFLEDDVKPVQDFFPFCQELLEKYKDEERVMVISGYKIVNDFPAGDTYFFSDHPMIWGWATWRRVWKDFDIDVKDWPENRRKGTIRKYYNFFGYLKTIRDLNSEYLPKVDNGVWDFQFTYLIQKKHGLSIIPPVNLIENIGFGRDDATHTKIAAYQDFSCGKLEFPLKHPDSFEVNHEYDKEYLRRGWGTLAIIKKVMNRIKSRLIKE